MTFLQTIRRVGCLMGSTESKTSSVPLDGCSSASIAFLGAIVCKSFIKIEINITGYDVNYVNASQNQESISKERLYPYSQYQSFVQHRYLSLFISFWWRGCSNHRRHFSFFNFFACRTFLIFFFDKINLKIYIYM